MTRLGAALALVLAPGYAACADGDATGADAGDDVLFEIPCESMRCDDADRCTDDRCDRLLGCVFVPRDATNACRFDAHCDDGLECTTDRCVVDDCQLERCVHLEDDCRTCGGWFDCGDDDACTRDECQAGLCTHTPEPLCEPHCRTPSGASSRDSAYAQVRTRDGCDACPCEHTVVVDASTPIVGLEPSCDFACADGAETASCEPLLYGEEYLVFGPVADGVLQVQGWCYAGALRSVMPMRGELQLPNELPLPVSVLRTEGATRLSCDAPGCPLHLPAAQIVSMLSDGVGLRMMFQLDQEPSVAVLVPTLTGLRGEVRRREEPTHPPASGPTIVLELDPSPRPVVR